MNELTSKSVKITILLVILISIILAVMHKFRWALGLLAGTGWSVINFLLLINLLKMAILQKSKANLFLTLMVKFPVLYLVGFLILNSRFFPVSSLLVGLGSILLITGVVNIWPRRT